ncbi:MAG TPA: LysM domain-containing protein [Candidatus Limnocylindria bacterium]|nr:LysM domain-containing protein [Candidatus Limnocylindria bacterium]
MQVKNTAADLERSVAFLFAITRCLQQNTAEFLSSARFEGLPAPDRGALETCLRDAVEEYSAQTLETLFAKHKHTVAMPSEVARSVTNAEYRQLLILAAKTIQHPRIELKRPTHHTVQVGESVISIARMYKVSPGSLIAANPGIVSGLVRVGQVLFVPLPAPATPAQRALSIKEGPERQSAKL